jgi:transcription elongation factor GreA
MNDQHYLTPDGEANMRAELEQLKGPERQAIAKRLRDAIQMGDLSENADYHKAKEDQGFLEGKIQELEFVLKNAEIIDTNSIDHETVQVGARVTIQEEDFPPETYFLVGIKEADPPNGRISNESPIGKALIGKKVGEMAEANTPNGSIRFKILKIE